MKTTAAVLSYSVATRRVVQHRAVILTTIFAISILLILTVWLVNHRAHVSVLVAQHSALNHSTNDEEIFFEDDPEKAAELLSTGAYDTWEVGSGAAVKKSPDYWKTLGMKARHGDCVFLHARRAKGGEERLVVVYLKSLSEGNVYRSIGLGISIVRPGTLTTDPDDHFPRIRDAFLTVYREDKLTIYAGLPDPDDASHFFIRYSASSGGGTLDGWLLPRDTVKLVPRDGPAKQAEEELARQ
jgi:hypothetical protein